MKLQRSLEVLISSLLLFCFVLATDAMGDQSGDFVEGEIVCELTNQAYLDTLNEIYGTTTKQFLSKIYGYLLQTPPGLDAESLATEISLDSHVIYCDANYLLDAPEPVQGSQPFIDLVGGESFTSQPAALAMALPTVHNTSTGNGVRVGVIDVGVDPTHPILAGSLEAGYDYVDDDTTPYEVPGGAASGHGTFVAGVIKLVAPQSVIVPYRVLDSAGRGDGFTVAEAILQAVADSCKVINLSMVMGGKHGAMDIAIEYARYYNVLVVCAAGNDSTEIDRFPASDSYTLSVAALDSNNFKADFSSYSGKVDVCAPGTQIYAPFEDTLFAWWNGTSFAAPFVAGQAALLNESNPIADWADIVNAIVETATNIDDINPAFEGMLGTGLINPSAALQLVSIKCADLNGDGQNGDITDLTYFVDFLFAGGPYPIIMSTADMNGSGGIPDIVDLTYFVDFMFLGGPAPNCP